MNIKIALSLLQTGSVHANLKQPFKLASGRLSPVYVDCRRLISFPKLREQITAQFAQITKRQIGLKNIDVIAGGETAGIPFAAFLAQKLKKPMIYVRKEPKGHGLTSAGSRQIEGVLKDKQKVLLVEDLITDGGSKLVFKQGIEVAGGILKHCLCVFEYACEKANLKEAREKLSSHGITLHSLVTWDDLLDIALAQKYFTQKEYTQVLNFLKDPAGWQKKLTSLQV